MSRPVVKAPWSLARSAQAAVTATAVADVYRAVTVRAHDLHPQDTSAASASGRASLVYANLMTVAVVLFLVWFSRSRGNAQPLSPSPLPGSASWAVFAWLVPVVNLWVPRRLVLDVRLASGPGANGQRDRVLVNAWWAAWVGHALAVIVGSRPGLGTSLAFLLVAEVLELAAGALAIAVIQCVASRQAAALASTLPIPGAASQPRLS